MWVDTGLKQPVGVAVDALGSVFVSSKELLVEGDVPKRAIGKIHPDTRLTDFAANLADPQGVAFGPDGSLYLADGRGGRLLRFVPPAPPTVTVPEFTAQSSLTVTGTTAAGARVDAFVNDATARVSAMADAAGAFSVPLTVPANAFTTLDAYATTQGGEGLTSLAAPASLRHDDVAPTLTFEAPPDGAHVRAAVVVAGRASDDGSGVAAVTLAVDGQALDATISTETFSRATSR